MRLEAVTRKCSRKRYFEEGALREPDMGRPMVFLWSNWKSINWSWKNMRKNQMENLILLLRSIRNWKLFLTVPLFVRVVLSPKLSLKNYNYLCYFTKKCVLYFTVFSLVIYKSQIVAAGTGFETHEHRETEQKIWHHINFQMK